MKFGFNQIFADTPIIIKKVKLGLNFFSGGVVAFLPFISSHTGITTDDLSSIMGIFILGFNTLGIMFGVSDSNTETK